MKSAAGYLRLMKLAAGFRESRIILAANEFDLFTALSEKQLRADEAAEKVRADARALAIIMDALTAMSFLIKENGLYRNSLVSTYKSNNVNWLEDCMFSHLQVPCSNNDKMGIFSNWVKLKTCRI